MNFIKTFKNSVISVIVQLLIMLLQFINRRMFVMFLDVEYLGYQSVFGSVFSILSVAEMGVGTIISFHLYREIVTDNEQEIGKLIYLYKWIYRFIAGIVAVCGMIACIFVPYIVKGANRDIHYLYIVYFLQLISTVLGYLLSYRRTIYVADQKEYKAVEIDLFTNLVIQVIQLSTLAIFRDYLLYLTIQLSTTLIADWVILYKTNREYPYLKRKYKITLDYVRERNMIPDLKNFLVHKIAYAIYNATDNIVISIVCGIRDVALFGNYIIIKNGVSTLLLYRLLNPVQATIGNIIYSGRKREELWKQFEMFDVFSFFFASYISGGFLVFSQPVIQIWLGCGDYLLPYSFVVALSLTIYVGTVWEIVYKYRNVFGDYRQDRNCMLISAFLNIVLSIVLARRFGVTGVQIGSLLALFPIEYGRIRFVVKNFFRKSFKKYLIKHLLLLFIVVFEGMIMYLLTKNMSINFIGMSGRIAVWATVPLVVNLLVYFRNSNFKDLCAYFKALINMAVEKVRKDYWK